MERPALRFSTILQAADKTNAAYTISFPSIRNVVADSALSHLMTQFLEDRLQAPRERTRQARSPLEFPSCHRLLPLSSLAGIEKMHADFRADADFPISF